VDPPEGVRRALRRTAFSGADGPLERLRNAAWELTQWRDFTGEWTRNPFDRQLDINDTIAVLREDRRAHASSGVAQRSARHEHRPVRRLADEIALHQEFGDPGAADSTAGKAGLVDLSRDRVLGNVRHGRGAMYKDGVRAGYRA
jgi:hypothetical protein